MATSFDDPCSPNITIGDESKYQSVNTGLFYFQVPSRPKVSDSTTLWFTIGGLVIVRLRRIPRIGDCVEEAGFRILVEEATERTAVRLRLEPA